jgi:hypothetical protein
LTIGGIGLIAGGASAIGRVSRAVLPTYHIANEERKRKTMLDQTAILQQIENSLNKNNVVKKQNPYSILSTQPLA